MTFGRLKEVLSENGIPDDAKLMSDSGWECDPTDMDGAYWNPETQTVVFTQGDYPEDDYERPPFVCLCLEGKLREHFKQVRK